MAAVPVASIPNLTAATKEWLSAVGFRNSEQVAHITEQYLAGFKTKKAITTELLKVADVLRGLHGVEVPNPFDNCPTFEKGELVLSAEEIMADLPDHAPEIASVEEASEPVETAVDKSVTAKRRGRPPASAAVDKPAPADKTPNAPLVIHADGDKVKRPPLYLYLECTPIKGAQFVTLEEFLDPVFSEVERSCGVQNWRSITEFGRLNEMLHVALRNIIEGRTEITLPQHLVVLSIYTEYAKATLDLLIRHATIVVRK
jgi:hypothetical protein